jgi:hypothetical protein
MRSFILSLLLLLSACATQQLDPAPDLSGYRQVEIISNSSHKRVLAPVTASANGAQLELQMPEGGSGQRLHVQADQCRNQGSDCPRSFALVGDLYAFQNRLKCFAEIRNDANSGYTGQSLQGLCQDPHGRSYSFTLTR